MHELFAHSEGFTETSWPAGNAAAVTGAAVTGASAAILEEVFSSYGHMSGIGMGEMAHRQAPCISAMARKTVEDPEPVIDRAEMRAFFKALDDAPEDQTAYANRYMGRHTDEALRVWP